METDKPTYRIKGWAKYHEKGEAKRHQEMKWVATPTNHEKLGFKAVAALPNADLIFSRWNLILQVAAKMSTRGLLVDNGKPLTAKHLALLTGFSVEGFEVALTTLSDPALEIGWVEVVGSTEVATNPGENPGQPREQSGQTRGNTEDAGGNPEYARATGEDRTLQDRRGTGEPPPAREVPGELAKPAADTDTLHESKTVVRQAVDGGRYQRMTGLTLSETQAQGFARIHKAYGLTVLNLCLAKADARAVKKGEKVVRDPWTFFEGHLTEIVAEARKIESGHSPPPAVAKPRVIPHHAITKPSRRDGEAD